jgi:hypothetical protein
MADRCREHRDVRPPCLVAAAGCRTPVTHAEAGGGVGGQTRSVPTCQFLEYVFY